jgi:TetR/AcrR family transcriptional regulator
VNASATASAGAHAERQPAKRATGSRTRALTSIHRAAAKVFAREGYNGATTQAIADAAGLSKQQLHYYIEGKEDLYRSILQGIVDDWIAVFGFADAQLGPGKVLADYVRRKLQFSFDHPERSRIFTAEIMRGATLLRPLMSHSHRRTQQATAVIRGWIAAGQMAPVNPQLLLFHIWAMTQHYADYADQVRYFDGPDLGAAQDRELLIAEVTAFVLRGAGVKAD